MKKNYLEKGRLSVLIVVLLTVVFSSCEVDDFTEAVPTGDANASPVVSIDQIPDTIPVFREFGITVNAEDNTPALSAVTLNILDSTGNTIYIDIIKLVGINDVASFEIAADTLPRGGAYTVEARVQDTEGQETTIGGSFFGRAPFSMNAEMFLLGTFNDFGGTDRRMFLSEDYTWTLTTEISNDDSFKFVNTSDFSDSDWGDAQCDNQAEPGTLENNIACGFDGENLITFNDQTLEYSVMPTDGSFNAVYEELYVIGNFTGWGNDNADLSVPMELIANNTWEAVVDATNSVDGTFDASSDNIIFKIFGTPSFGQPDFGDGNSDGILDTDPDNNIDLGLPAGEYRITLNDVTLEYSIRGNFESNFDEVFVIGNFTGWGSGNADLSVPMRLIDNNSWEADIDATMSVDGAYDPASDDIQFKFVLGPDFGPMDFGVDPTGDATALMGAAFDGDGETNMQPPLRNILAKINFNDETLEYTVTPE
ncbi:MAG: hypothetical protein AAGF85_01915 [Bacteroidota bacterium]